MTTDRQLRDALSRATERIIERPLTDSETTTLIRYFNEAQGSIQDRAKEAILKVAKITESVLLEKVASSDDTDRIMQDLEAVASEWKPDDK